MTKGKATVVIPTYNERETIAQLVQSVLAQQECIPDVLLNVLVVDGHSSDGTGQWVADKSQGDPRVALLNVAERGLGIALLKGYEYAIAVMGSDIIAQMDGDLSHDPRYLLEMLHAVMNGSDLVIGSRYIRGGGTQGWPPSRRILSWGANLVIRLITGHWHLREWTSGYRVFTADLYHRLDLPAITYRDYTLVPALVYEAVLKGASVQEVPIIFVNRKWGSSKLPMVRYIVNLLKHFTVTRVRSLFRKGSNARSTCQADSGRLRLQ